MYCLSFLSISIYILLARECGEYLSINLSIYIYLYYVISI